MADSIFVLEGEFASPTEYARGPWAPDFCDGAAVAALLAHTVEDGRSNSERQLSRLTIDLLAPVPMQPLRVTRQQVHEGQRIEIVDVSVQTEDGQLVCRCSALLIAEGEQRPFEMPDTDIELGPGPEESRPFRVPSETVSFLDIHETRFSRMSSSELPGAGWGRLSVPVFPDAPITPLVNAGAMTDRVSALTALPPDGRQSAINADITAHFGRQPVGEWVAAEGFARLAGEGQGLGSAYLRDELGLFGVAAVSLMPSRFEASTSQDVEAAFESHNEESDRD